MKFIHIADVHIGAKPDSNFPWSQIRSEEIANSLKRVLEICEKEQIDLLLIAGDLFHKQPLLRELKELNYQFSKLTRTQVVIIAGNHDFVGMKSHYIDFEWAKNVHMLLAEEMESVILPELHTEVYGFSYHSRNVPQAKYDGVYPKENGYYHILLAHGGDERNIPIDRKQIKELPFDYVALGHIHKPEMIGKRAAYAGCLEPMDKTETGPRGFIYGELDEAGLRIRFVPNSLRRYEWLEIKVSSDMTLGAVADFVKAGIDANGDENIYRVHLVGYRDVDLVFDTAELMKYGNVIEVVDDTVPDYDFCQLKEENSENIIGLYIDKIHESNQEEEIKRKALYLGLEALLHARK